MRVRLMGGVVVLAAAALVILFAFNSLSSSAEWLTVYNRLEVGRPVPEWTGKCNTGPTTGPATPSGKFHVHLSGNYEQMCCFDLECPTDIAAQVISRGGHLNVSSDLKFAKILGVPVIHDGKEWRSAENLMIINDEQGKIVSIVRNAGLRDVHKAILRAGF